MKQFCITNCAYLLTLSLVLAGHAGHAAPLVGDIRNFHEVAKDLYRGGQPTASGLSALKELGVKTIINLRSDGDREQTTVHRLGMKYVHIPLDAWERLPADAVRTFLRVLCDPASYPVFVHCRRGADRTGIMIGLYRITFQGWDATDAYEEARKLGMRWWYRGLKRQLYEFAEWRWAMRGSSVTPFRCFQE
ncbi:MAG: protein tyrosine phosphatase family protein [Acidobacteria bacterium]|nr:protein tyrosine phosphatase family protein [Acidobacteriota bacterium]